MSKFLKIAGFTVAGTLLLIGAVTAYISISGIPTYDRPVPELQVEADSVMLAKGERLTAMNCGNCHMGKDRKLSGGPMIDVPKEFGTIYAPNITKHPEKGLGRYSDGELLRLLRTGIKKDGSYAPPYMAKFPNMSDYDIQSIIAFLRSDHRMVQPSEAQQPATEPSFLTKLLCRVAFKPFDMPSGPIVAPSPDDEVAYGKYVATAMTECYSCHSADFKTNDYLVPENSEGYFGGGNTLLDYEGKEVKSSNLTMDPATGLGNWTVDEFVMTVKHGQAPDRQPVSSAMPKFTLLTDDEVRAIWTYLQTLEPVNNVAMAGTN